ncbi:hypothetical protein BCR33DRAFT_761415 [Rhizoclosmatium globosum]|uniref:Uncharacterized protein n=1 Tax=Rhizoclosmatium globosum TaxID=329046 RepID=A0A1Y2D1Z8_9FUNG|nr:hypothetical protein BCR33DRAFT_761415 [Rhizoclosmatium globosum]|eukprot:ORY53154.1 hypothetical protein BCR33DRAFT_761415 [Rhizoclosmatium globosum]
MSPVQGPSASSITSEKVYASVREENEAFLKPAEEIWGSIIGQLLFVGEYQEVGRHLHRSVVLRSTFHYIFGSNHTAIVYNSLKNHPAIHFKKSKRLTVEVDSIRAPLNLPLDDLKQQPDYSPNLRYQATMLTFQQSLKISCFPFTSLDTSKLQEPELIPKTTKQKTLPISHTGMLSNRPFNKIYRSAYFPSQASSFEETCEAMTISELENAIQNHQAMALLDRHHHESQKELSAAKTILTEQIQCLEEMHEFRVCERESVPVSSKSTVIYSTNPV